jgi:pyrroloquinoline-quinone synthase
VKPTGLKREEIVDLRHVVPGVRFAVDAYINFARQRPWQEAVCSSLTELFAPKIHKERLANWPSTIRGSNRPACSTSATA